MKPTKYVHIKSTTVYAPRRNWDSPQPPPRRLVCPLPPVSGGRGTLAGEKGVGRVPIPTGAYTVVLFICTYFVVKPKRKNLGFFGLFRCFEPISKQPKQTELFQNKPKQPKIFRKIPKYTLYQTVSVGPLFVSVHPKSKVSVWV